MVPRENLLALVLGRWFLVLGSWLLVLSPLPLPLPSPLSLPLPARAERLTKGKSPVNDGW
jgi:hypothetical protein